MADSLYAVKTLVYDEKKLSMKELKEALTTNYGHGLNQEDIAVMTSEVAQDMAAAGQQVGPTEIAAILQSVVAKEMILHTDVPCIVNRGRKGGSNVAAAICNALLYEVRREDAAKKVD